MSTLLGLAAVPAAVAFTVGTPETTPAPMYVTIEAWDAHDGVWISPPIATVTLTPAAGTPSSLFSTGTPSGDTFDVSVSASELSTLLATPGTYGATVTVTCSPMAAGDDGAPAGGWTFTTLEIPVSLTINPQVASAAAPMTLEAEPGFTEMLDAWLATGMPLTTAVVKALNAAIKFAAVRTEVFYGYYAIGETVPVPTSLIDGYNYSREELRYVWSVYWTASPGPGFVEGSIIAPTTGATSAAGTLLQFGYYVDQNTGDISGKTSYYTPGKSQSDTTDGILMVHTIAKRLRT